MPGAQPIYLNMNSVWNMIQRNDFKTAIAIGGVGLGIYSAILVYRRRAKLPPGPIGLPILGTTRYAYNFMLL